MKFFESTAAEIFSRALNEKAIKSRAAVFLTKM